MRSTRKTGPEDCLCLQSTQTHGPSSLEGLWARKRGRMEVWAPLGPGFLLWGPQKQGVSWHGTKSGAHAWKPALTVQLPEKKASAQILNYDSRTEILSSLYLGLRFQGFRVHMTSKNRASEPQDCGWDLLSQRLHVALWYIHRPQAYEMVAPSSPMYIPYSYMEPLGLDCRSSPKSTAWPGPGSTSSTTSSNPSCRPTRPGGSFVPGLRGFQKRIQLRAL